MLCERYMKSVSFHINSNVFISIVHNLGPPVRCLVHSVLGSEDTKKNKDMIFTKAFQNCRELRKLNQQLQEVRN